MSFFNMIFNPSRTDGVDEEQSSNYYNTLLIFLAITAATIAIIRFVESRNRLDYQSRTARIIAGFLILLMQMWHTKKDDLELSLNKNIVTIGPHRTGIIDGLVVASKIKGRPPYFLATTAYDFIPGIGKLRDMFQGIPVQSSKTAKENGRSVNAGAVDRASQVLKEEGSIVLFPQGNLDLGKKPHRIYPGAAKLAVEHNIPIHVIRLDGFWCVTNPFIPLFIRNNIYYRAFLSMFHMNDVRTTLCCVIDFHLKEENKTLSTDEKINEINAQLYAYYRDAGDLNEKQIEAIKPKISKNVHQLMWSNKLEQEDLGKELIELEKKEAELDTLPALSAT